MKGNMQLEYVGVYKNIKEEQIIVNGFEYYLRLHHKGHSTTGNQKDIHTLAKTTCQQGLEGTLAYVS